MPDIDTSPAAPWEWHLGAMNDGLFIINAPPRPSTDDIVHDREDGPTMILNVTDLPEAKAQAIVNAHNAAIHALAAKKEASDRVPGCEAPARVLAEWLGYAWDGLHDRDISNRYPDWVYDDIGGKKFQGGRPALRRVAQAMLAAATVKPDLTVGEEVTPLKAVAVMGVRPPLAQESSPIISTTVDLRTLAGAATPGPWQVVTYRTPFSITRHDGTTCSGEHVGRDIATVRHHPQSHAPYPIVTLGIGVTQETPVHFVFIRPEDADYLAAVSPEVVLALLDTIDSLRASLAAAEKERDALRLAILGGEDAPGYATTVSIDDVISTLEDGRRLYRYCAEKAEAERGKLIMALDHLLYPKPASGTRVYTLPDGQRECLTAKQYDEACARHLLQTLATQDLLALSPGVETSPASDGWTAWKGGECPVHGGLLVDVRRRDGYVETGLSARFWRWDHRGVANDIVAYRVVGARDETA